MKRLIIISSIFIIVASLFVVSQARLLARPSQGGPETMAAANRLYESGQFDQAALAYQQLVDQGFADSSLYYNLGNAYFKQGDVGQAVLNYRRAERLDPRDGDIKANLDLARDMTVDQIEKTSNESFLSQLARFTQERLTINELALGTLGIWFLLAIFLIAFASSRPGSNLREALQYASIVTAFLMAIGSFSLLSRLHVENTRPAAVVVANEVDVTSGPGSQSVIEFSLHDGTEVSLIEERNNWVRLALPGNELQGWVPTDTVSKVVP